ncbi:MAG TPA: hypothetical protein VFE98_06100 [Candidatus Bathyarchaeia archaeon]|nr:hypothetical protein [Candidatus Bathyarchaeia archaeon]
MQTDSGFKPVLYLESTGETITVARSMSTLVPVGAKKRAYKRNLVAVGLILLALGAYTEYDAKSFSTYNSTFNILALKYFKITDNLKDTATITGQFTETGGRAVSFLIMNSLQYAQYQTRQGNASLYSVLNTASARISYTFPSADSYFLLFLHGSRYLNTTETVGFQRTYIALGRFELFSGAILLGLAVLLLFWGLRPRDMARFKGLPSQSETPDAKP